MNRQRDIVLLFATRFTRMYAYGLLSIVLVFYLTRIGFDERMIGLLLSLTLAGDLLISLWMTTRAGRIGRRKMLIVGALLMVLAGVVFVSTTFFPLLLIAAIRRVLRRTRNAARDCLPIARTATSREL